MSVKFYVYHDHVVLNSQFMLDLLNEIIQLIWFWKQIWEMGYSICHEKAQRENHTVLAEKDMDKMTRSQYKQSTFKLPKDNHAHILHEPEPAAKFTTPMKYKVREHLNLWAQFNPIIRTIKSFTLPAFKILPGVRHRREQGLDMTTTNLAVPLLPVPLPSQL